jgi:hypothetical protein
MAERTDAANLRRKNRRKERREKRKAAQALQQSVEVTDAEGNVVSQGTKINLDLKGITDSLILEPAFTMPEGTKRTLCLCRVPAEKSVRIEVWGLHDPKTFVQPVEKTYLVDLKEFYGLFSGQEYLIDVKEGEKVLGSLHPVNLGEGKSGILGEIYDSPEEGPDNQAASIISFLMKSDDNTCLDQYRLVLGGIQET